MVLKKRVPKKILPAVGWREWVALPEFGVPRIKVKIDTGARTSALHAFEPRFISRGQRTWVSFIVHPLQRDSRVSIPCRAEVIEWRNVRSSNGRGEERPVIRAMLGMLGETWPIELTLTNRDDMGFRMLLGREALRRRVVVNPARSFLGERGVNPSTSFRPR